MFGTLGLKYHPRALVLGFALLAGCSDSRVSDIPQQVGSSVELEPAFLTVDPGQSAVVTAYVVDGNGKRVLAKSPAYTVEWSVTNSAIATVTANGAIATVTGVGGGAAQVQAIVREEQTAQTMQRTATVTTQPAAVALRIAAGNYQSAAVFSTLPQQLTVQVLNRNGFGVSGMPVRFALRNGDGLLGEQQVTSDEAGFARSTFTFGSQPGLVTIEASVAGVPAVTFDEIAIAAPAALEEYQGNLQQGPEDSPLPAPLGVRVLDSTLKPLPGVTVSWTVTSGGGQITSTSISDNAGVATAFWTLGAAGMQTAKATHGNINANFHATAVKTQPDRLIKVSGDGQSGAVGSTLPQPLVVRVIDGLGNPKPGVAVAFSVTSGGGSVNPTQIATDAAGFAQTTWTVGSVAGLGAVRAAATNIGSLTFNSTILATGSSTTTPPVVASLILTPQTVTLTALGAQSTLSATTKDANGQVVTGQTINYTSSNPMVVTVDNMGRLTAKGVGTALVIATALCCDKADTTAVTVTQQVAAVSVAPKSVSLAAGGSQQVSASAVDANGNPVAGVQYTWATSNSSVATVSAGLIRAVSAGSAYIRVGSGSYQDSVAVTVTAANSTPVLTTITLTPSNPSLLVGASQTFSAVAKDQNGNAMTGVTFNWSSSNPSVMSVSNGVVTALAVGLAVLNVTSNGVNASTQVSITSAPVSGGAALFADNFDTGSLKSGGWKSLGTNVFVSTANPHSGSHSLMFHYKAKTDECQDATAEQRFTMPNLKEVWIEYWFYLPANYAHRLPSGCPSNAANQKLIRVWGPTEGDYSAANPKAGASFDPISGGPDSKVYVQWGDADDVMMAGQEAGSNWGQAFTDATRGKWMLMRWHFKLASGPNTADGAAQLWVDGVLKVNLQNRTFFGTNGNWFSTGYLMGWANSSYAADTDFFVDDFKIFNSNPGW